MRALPQLADRPGCSLGGLGHTTPLRTPPSLTHRYVQQRASRGRRPGSHNALVSAALGHLSTRQLPRRTGSHNALAGAAQPLTPIGTHSGILSSSAPLRLLRPRFGVLRSGALSWTISSLTTRLDRARWPVVPPSGAAASRQSSFQKSIHCIASHPP